MTTKHNSSGGGSITIQPPVTAGNYTLTLPAATGTVSIDGPAFSAFLPSNQAVTSATFTKVQLSAETFDTANAFDATTNYRFQPTVAGYYQLNGAVAGYGTTHTGTWLAIYKNGSQYKRGSYTPLNVAQVNISDLVYLNGSTDYVELWGWSAAASASGLTGNVNGADTWFSGALVRAA